MILTETEDLRIVAAIAETFHPDNPHCDLFLRVKEDSAPNGWVGVTVADLDRYMELRREIRGQGRPVVP